jgi:hypothetical protein
MLLMIDKAHARLPAQQIRQPQASPPIRSLRRYVNDPSKRELAGYSAKRH